LPVSGGNLYVRLWSLIDGVWRYGTDKHYLGQKNPDTAHLTSPAEGWPLAGASQLFQWDASPIATLYQLWVGTIPGAYDLGYFPQGGTTDTSVVATGLPTDGRVLYVRLYTNSGNYQTYVDYTYRAASSASAAPSSITSPVKGTTLAGATQLFEWNDAGATYFQLWVGNTPGAYDIGYFPEAGTSDHSVTATGLPTDGRTLYVTLYSMVDGVYQSRTTSYVAATAAPTGPAQMTFPAPGARLGNGTADPTQTFMWTSAPGARLYQVWIGNTPGAYDIGYYPEAGTAETSTVVTGLPTDGRTLYVRLWSLIYEYYDYNDYVYQAPSPDFPPPS
jgi:hypothetical protein